VAQERALDPQRLRPDAQGLGRARDRLLERLGIARERLEGVGRVGEAPGELLGHRRGRARAVLQLVDEPGQLRPRLGQDGGDVAQRGEERREPGEGPVQGRAARGQPGPELGQVALGVRARVLVEDVEEVLQLGRDPVLGHRHRRAVGQRAPVLAAAQLDVAQAERGARPDADRGVDRHVARGLVDLQRQLRADAPVAQLHRLDPVDHADPVAALAHLVADHQLGRVVGAHLELRGGDERQPGVGVVGQEDRDDADEARHRADEHGVAEDPCRRAPHGPNR